MKQTRKPNAKRENQHEFVSCNGVAHRHLLIRPFAQMFDSLPFFFFLVIWFLFFVNVAMNTIFFGHFFSFFDWQTNENSLWHMFWHSCFSDVQPTDEVSIDNGKTRHTRCSCHVSAKWVQKWEFIAHIIMSMSDRIASFRLISISELCVREGREQRNLENCRNVDTNSRHQMSNKTDFYNTIFACLKQSRDCISCG